MKIHRTGKCATCKKPIKVTRDFPETINMFDTATNQKKTISREVVNDVLQWRGKPIFCKEHIQYETW